MSIVDTAWVAGLFEGEGYIRRPPQLQIAIQMTDYDVLERFRDITNANRITFHDRPKPNVSRIYRVLITGKDRVRTFLIAILPYLGMRRAHKALDVLDYIECT